MEALSLALRVGLALVAITYVIIMGRRVVRRLDVPTGDGGREAIRRIERWQVYIMTGVAITFVLGAVIAVWLRPPPLFSDVVFAALALAVAVFVALQIGKTVKSTRIDVINARRKATRDEDPSAED